jgi:WD40 repeat protein
MRCGVDVEQPSSMVRSRVARQTSSRMFLADTSLTSCAVATTLAVTWRNWKAQIDSVEKVLSIACVGPAHTVEIWNCHPYSIPVYSCALTYYGHADEITALVWSPDTTLLASASEDHTVQIWDAHTGYAVMIYRGQHSGVRALGWSPDGCYLTIGCDDNVVRTVHILEQRVSMVYNGHAQGFYGIDAVAWSPDGQYVASAGDDNMVQVWDALTGQPLMVYLGHRDRWVLTVAWSPDGRWIASGGDDIHIWSLQTGLCKQIYSKHEYTQYWVDHIGWSPDGSLIASTSTDSVLHIWDVWTGFTIQTQMHPGRENPCHGLLTNALAWLPDASMTVPYKGCLAFASYDKTVSLIGLL